MMSMWPIHAIMYDFYRQLYIETGSKYALDMMLQSVRLEQQ